MENNIRIGKDFNVQWAINKVVDGERLPYDLVGKELQLYIVNDNGRKEVAGWKVQGNVIQWTFLGKDQKRLGAYQLVLVENAGKEGMVTVDTCKAFNLVAHSCEENVDGGSAIVIETVTLESEVALAHLRGPQGEQGPVGPQGPQGPAGPSYDDTELRNAIAEIQTKDTQTDAKLTELSTEVNEVAEKIDNINPTPMASVTYAELVELRDNGELVPGMQYRITDFVTTSVQDNTRSAGNQFDIIVTADSANTLNEVARACLHEGDTYFSGYGAKLEAWQIWYSLDNDVTRFAWADSDNGKGVIYRMIDEHRNDCPYDFKNIQFIRPLSFDNGMAEYNDEGEDTWVYTFAGQSYHMDDDLWSEMLDGSLESPFRHITDEGRYSTFHDNIIKPHVNILPNDEDPSHGGIIYLNNNVLFGYWEESVSADAWSFPFCCYANRFDENCFDNTLNHSCNNNVFGIDCQGNLLMSGCCNNVFGCNSSFNSLRFGCRMNTFGNYVEYIIFGDNCSFNIIKDNCHNIIIGLDGISNYIGQGCSAIHVGDMFAYNKIGDQCMNLSFIDKGDHAHNIMHWVVENDVVNMTFKISKPKQNYQNIQYYHICPGVRDEFLEVYDGRVWQTYVAVSDSAPEIVQFTLSNILNS